MKDYTFYIAAAYSVCFIVLAWMTISTFIAWNKVKDEIDE